MTLEERAAIANMIRLAYKGGLLAGKLAQSHGQEHDDIQSKLLKLNQELADLSDNFIKGVFE